MAMRVKLSRFALVVAALGLLVPAPGSGSQLPYQPGAPVRQEDPALTAAIEKIALSYQKGLGENARQRELQIKSRAAQQWAGISRLSDLRARSMALLLQNGKPFEWESLRRLGDDSAKPAGVWLTVPVWLPRGAREIPTYGSPVERWQAIGSGHRFAGKVYLPPTLAAINDKKSYQAATLTFETSRGFAPFAYLLLDAIFREGWLDPSRRVPILSVRSGEDSYAADPRPASGTIPCFDFSRPDGRDLVKQTVQVAYQQLSSVYHGHHAQQSNHRLGCALDINDINCEKCKDGSPNPISRAGRQFLRDRMHALDARNLPYWVYQQAESIGYRVPYQWHYGNGYTDWQHLDCGVLDNEQWEKLQKQLVCAE
jgi:hypothetical protein